MRGMGPAIHGITDVKFQTTYEELRLTAIPYWLCPWTPAPECCPMTYNYLTFEIGKLLASDLPSMQQLCVDGCCEQATFDGFEFAYQQLKHMIIDVTTFPVKALGRVGMKCSHLSCITLNAPSQSPFDTPLYYANFVAAALSALSSVKSLVKVVLDFDSSDYLECQPGCWSDIPRNLREFVISCQVFDIHHASKLLAQLNTLSLSSPTEEFDVFKILTRARNLQLLTFSSLQPIQLHSVNAPIQHITAGVSLLNQRVLSGLCLSVPTLLITGSSSMIHSTIFSLPALHKVCRLKLQYTDDHTPDYLEHIPEAFPELTELHLLRKWTAYHNTSNHPDVGYRQLESLVGCKSLSIIRMQATLSITTEQFANWCAAMPSLKHVWFLENACVTVAKLKQILTAQGQATVVAGYVNH